MYIFKGGADTQEVSENKGNQRWKKSRVNVRDWRSFPRWRRDMPISGTLCLKDLSFSRRRCLVSESPGDTIECKDNTDWTGHLFVTCRKV